MGKLFFPVYVKSVDHGVTCLFLAPDKNAAELLRQISDQGEARLCMDCLLYTSKAQPLVGG